MLNNTKYLVLVLATGYALLYCCTEASAFMTFSWFGGAIHRHILNDALSGLGVSNDSLSIIGKGCDSQDLPLTAKYTTCPQNHCDDEKISQGCQYWRGRVDQAVVDAAHADTDPKQRRKALFEFGEAMHTVQDFYSHANYLEWLLQNHKALVPVDWDNLPAPIRTGYYYYDHFLVEEAFISRARSVRGLEKTHQHLSFRPADEYLARSKSESYSAALDYALRPGTLLHKELNKDSPKTMEGRIVAREYDKTLHDLARQLATADTARQWKHFEQLIVDAYGDRSTQIIAALKGKNLRVASFD